VLLLPLLLPLLLTLLQDAAAFRANYRASDAFVTAMEARCCSLDELSAFRGCAASLQYAQRWNLKVYAQLHSTRLQKAILPALTASLTRAVPTTTDTAAGSAAPGSSGGGGGGGGGGGRFLFSATAALCDRIEQVRSTLLLPPAVLFSCCLFCSLHHASADV